MEDNFCNNSNNKSVISEKTLPNVSLSEYLIKYLLELTFMELQKKLYTYVHVNVSVRYVLWHFRVVIKQFRYRVANTGFDKTSH